jgi:hypothetical protein
MFWQLIFLVAFIFVITYDPKSGTLDHLVGKKPEKPPQNAECKEGTLPGNTIWKNGVPVSNRKEERTWVRL